MDRSHLNYLAIKLRKNFGLNEDDHFNIFNLLLKKTDITIVEYPFSKHISGMCIKTNSTNLIAVNSSMILARQNFSLAHELYHLYYSDEEMSISEIDTNRDSELENNADYFASCFLIPYNTLRNEIDKSELTIKRLIQIENKYGISHNALIYRLKLDELINSKQEKEFNIKGIKKTAMFYGYDGELYETKGDNFKFTSGGYIEKVKKLKKENRISNGKYKELLITAFRENLAFKNYNKA